MAKTVGIRLTEGDFKRWADRAKQTGFKTIPAFVRSHVEKAFDTLIDRPGSTNNAHFNIRCRLSDKERWEDEAARLGCSLAELVRNRMNAFVARADTIQGYVEESVPEPIGPAPDAFEMQACQSLGHDWFLQKSTWKCKRCGKTQRER